MIAKWYGSAPSGRNPPLFSSCTLSRLFLLYRSANELLKEEVQKDQGWS